MIKLLNLTSPDEPLWSDDPVYFEIESDAQLVVLDVMCEHRGVLECAFSNGSFFSPYAARSEAGVEGGRLWIRLRRDPRWVAPVVLRVVAADENGTILQGQDQCEQGIVEEITANAAVIVATGGLQTGVAQGVPTGPPPTPIVLKVT